MWFFVQRDKLEELPKDAAIWETATIYHRSDAESNQNRICFIIFCLIGTTVLNVLIDRCDASINVIRKYGAAPARIKPPDQKYFNQF